MRKSAVALHITTQSQTDTEVKIYIHVVEYYATRKRDEI
jgi:hypothetical protein